MCVCDCECDCVCMRVGGSACLCLLCATDVYILKGDPNGETFEPHFTYHGFRYCEVLYYPGLLSPSNIV